MESNNELNYKLETMSCDTCGNINDMGIIDCEKCLEKRFPNEEDRLRYLDYLDTKKDLESEKNIAIDMGIYDIGQETGELNFGGPDLTIPTLERTCTRYDCHCYKKGVKMCQKYNDISEENWECNDCGGSHITKSDRKYCPMLFRY
jgi:hypothetical protein